MTASVAALMLAASVRASVVDINTILRQAREASSLATAKSVAECVQTKALDESAVAGERAAVECFCIGIREACQNLTDMLRRIDEDGFVRDSDGYENVLEVVEIIRTTVGTTQQNLPKTTLQAKTIMSGLSSCANSLGVIHAWLRENRPRRDEARRLQAQNDAIISCIKNKHKGSIKGSSAFQKFKEGMRHYAIATNAYNHCELRLAVQELNLSYPLLKGARDRLDVLDDSLDLD